MQRLEEYITAGTYSEKNNLEELVNEWLRVNGVNDPDRQINFPSAFFYDWYPELKSIRIKDEKGIVLSKDEIKIQRESFRLSKILWRIEHYLLKNFTSCKTSNQIQNIVDFFKENLGKDLNEISVDVIKRNPVGHIKDIYKITSPNINSKDFQKRMFSNKRYSTQKNSSCVIETVLDPKFNSPKLIIKKSPKTIPPGGSNTLIYPGDPVKTPSDPTNPISEYTSILVKTKRFDQRNDENERHNELTHEAVVGLFVVNEMRKYTSGAMFTYGYFNYFLNDKIEAENGGSTLLLEYFAGSPVREFVSEIIDLADIDNINKQKNFIKGFCEIFFQVFSTLHSGKQWNFTHCDLHYDNVLYLSNQQEKIYPIFVGNQNLYLRSKYEAKIIDFGRSNFEISGVRFLNDSFAEIPFILVDFCKFVGFCSLKNRITNQRLTWPEYMSTDVGQFFEKLLEIGWDKPRGTRTSLSEMLYDVRRNPDNLFFFEPDAVKIQSYTSHAEIINYVLDLARSLNIDFEILTVRPQEDDPDFRLNNINEISTFNQIMDHQKVPDRDNKRIAENKMFKLFKLIIEERQEDIQKVYLDIFVDIFNQYGVTKEDLLKEFNRFSEDYLRLNLLNPLDYETRIQNIRKILGEEDKTDVVVLPVRTIPQSRGMLQKFTDLVRRAARATSEKTKEYASKGLSMLGF